MLRNRSSPFASFIYTWSDSMYGSHENGSYIGIIIFEAAVITLSCIIPLSQQKDRRMEFGCAGRILRAPRLWEIDNVPMRC